MFLLFNRHAAANTTYTEPAVMPRMSMQTANTGLALETTQRPPINPPPTKSYCPT